MHASDPVNRIMSEPVLTIGWHESVSTMMRLFLSHQVHHLPVVDGRRVVGMLSSADLMKLEFFLPPAGPQTDALLNERWRIAHIMRSPVISVTEHETVQRAAEVMATNAIHALPVVNSNGELIGIVTTTDLIRCWLNPPAAVPASGAEDARRFPLDAAHAVAVHERVRSLEQVLTAAKRYVNAGQDERLHAELLKAIERDESLDERTRHATPLGLGIGA